jgi:hypothetical protein
MDMFMEVAVLCINIIRKVKAKLLLAFFLDNFDLINRTNTVPRIIVNNKVK